MNSDTNLIYSGSIATAPSINFVVVPTIINIKVANLRKIGYNSLLDWLNIDNNHIYIGRNMIFYAPGAIGSKWKNPYKVAKEGKSGYSIEESLKLYEEKIRLEMWDELNELEGKIMGCWCKPNACHGDILIKLFLEKNG